MPHCSNCGTMVTPTFARVFADNDGRVHGCVQCRDPTEPTGDGDDETRSSGMPSAFP